MSQYLTFTSTGIFAAQIRRNSAFSNWKQFDVGN